MIIPLKEPLNLPDGLTIEELEKRIINLSNIKINDQNQNTENLVVYTDLSTVKNLKEDGRKAWENLHSMKEPSIEKIEEWIKTVPSYGCGCQNFAREYITQNPPDFNNFFEWTWKFHDIVDQKTGDERISFEKAKEIWGV